MASVTVRIPDELENAFTGTKIELSEFLSEALKLRKPVRLALLKAMTSESKLSESEAERFAQELSARIKKDRFDKASQGA